LKTQNLVSKVALFRFNKYTDHYLTATPKTN